MLPWPCRRRGWVNGLSEGLAVKDLQTVHRIVAALWAKLESEAEGQT